MRFLVRVTLIGAVLCFASAVRAQVATDGGALTDAGTKPTDMVSSKLTDMVSSGGLTDMVSSGGLTDMVSSGGLTDMVSSGGPTDMVFGGSDLGVGPPNKPPGCDVGTAGGSDRWVVVVGLCLLTLALLLLPRRRRSAGG